MKPTEFLTLRDITQGNFAIKGGSLLYKGKQIAAQGKAVLVSAEEAFFLFEVEDAETIKSENFKQVFLLNNNRPYFYTSIEYKLESQRFQFISPLNGKNAFRLISFMGSYSQTKIVGDNYHEEGLSYHPWWRL